MKVPDLDFSFEIIATKIVPEAVGVAMSSRNVLLLCEEREKFLENLVAPNASAHNFPS